MSFQENSGESPKPERRDIKDIIDPYLSDFYTEVGLFELPNSTETSYAFQVARGALLEGIKLALGSPEQMKAMLSEIAEEHKKDDQNN